MVIFVDNINFKNEDNFKSLFSYFNLNNIKYIKNTFGDNGLKLAQGNYTKFLNSLPADLVYSKEVIFNKYWTFFKDELLLYLLKKEELYSSNYIKNDRELFDYIYLNFYQELQYNLRATKFWIEYWNKYLNTKNIYICFANTLIYTKTLSFVLQKYQIPLYVMEHFATGNDFYFDRRYTHIPNNIDAPKIEFTIQKFSCALQRLEAWDNKNVKHITSPRKALFSNSCTFLLATQVVNDFSIICTARKYVSIINYYKIVIDKVMSETSSNLLIKTHPYEKIKNGQSITYDILDEYVYKYHNKNIHRIKIVEDYNLDILIDNIQCAILFNSQMAFEIANKGKPIITLGSPFYKGYFTIDEDIDTLLLKEAKDYKFYSEGYKQYLTQLMEFLYNNNDIEKIQKKLLSHQLEIRELKTKAVPKTVERSALKNISINPNC